MDSNVEKQPILALPGPQYCYNYSDGVPIFGHRVIIHQEGGQVSHRMLTIKNPIAYTSRYNVIAPFLSVLQGRGTAWAVWDGAVAVAKHLERLAELDASWAAALPSQSILELGSGTGLAGLAAAAALGLPVTLTDLPEALPALSHNVSLNPPLAALATVTACDWYKPEAEGLRNSNNGPFGLVIAADCVWVESLVAPLVSALEKMVTGAGCLETRVLLGYQSRSARVDELLFGLLKESFRIEPAQVLDGEPDRGKIELFWLHPLSSLFENKE